MSRVPAALDLQRPSLLVYTERRRVRVPLSDSYFADPIADLLADDFDGSYLLGLPQFSS